MVETFVKFGKGSKMAEQAKSKWLNKQSTMKLFDDTTWIASAGKLEKLQPMILSAAQVSKTKNKKQ